MLCINTTGAETYLEGAERAFLALAKSFVRPPARKVKKGLNILGAIHLDIGKPSHLNPLFSLLKETGWEIISCLSMGSHLEEIKRASCASLNLVIGRSGLKLAKFMYETYGIPYVIGLPVGEKMEKEFGQLLEGKQVPLSKTEEKKRAVIIGEPVISYSLKRCLQVEFGIKAQVISLLPFDTLFTENKGCIGSLLERDKNDIYTTSEAKITALINQPEIDIIIADPCYARLIADHKCFIPLPHIAMSARFYWEMDYEYIGRGGGEYLKRWLEVVR